MSRKVRYGLLGASMIARHEHIEAIRAAENAELVGIASRRASKAAEWAAEMHIPRAYQSYDDMLADPEIDAVVNTLPMSLHCEWIVRAAEAGKHTLCEKPMALSVEEAETIQRVAEKCGVVVMEGFTHRFQQQMRFVKELLKTQEIGKIKIIRAEVIYPTSDWENDTRAQADLGGCVTVEAGCYAADTIRYFMEAEPLEVTGYATQREPGGIDTSFVGIMRFSEGRLALMCTSMETSFRAYCEIIGNEGRIEMPELFTGRYINIIQGSKQRVHEFDTRSRFVSQVEHFSDCILNGAVPEITLDDSLNNTKLLIALKNADKGQM